MRWKGTAGEEQINIKKGGPMGVAALSAVFAPGASKPKPLAGGFERVLEVLRKTNFFLIVEVLPK